MGLRITSYSPAVLYPIDNASPEEIEYVVISDISGDDITDEDLWKVDGDVCSEDEMLELFNDSYVSKVEDGDEYEKAKRYLIDERGCDEDMFKDHPDLLRIDVPDMVAGWDCMYAFAEDFDPIEDDYLPNDFHRTDIDHLEPEDEDY